MLALLFGAAALWAASRLSWVQVRTEDDLRGVRVSTITGGSWAAELAPLALAALAAIAATFALRGVALRILVSLVLFAVGVGAALPGLQILFGGASHRHAAELATPPALAEHVSTSVSIVGPLLSVLGALLIWVAAGTLARIPRTAGGMASRYQTPAVLKEEATAAGGTGDEDMARGNSARENIAGGDPARGEIVGTDRSERLLWDAMDAGYDPTVDTAEAERSASPVPPKGDADHHPDRVSDVDCSRASQAKDTRGARRDHERS